MKKNIVLFILFIIISAFSYGQFPDDSVSQSLKKAYAQLTNTKMYGVYYWGLGECRSENSEVGGESPNDLAPLQDIMIYEGDDANTYARAFWDRAYTIIVFSNFVIENASSVGLTSNVTKRYIAEAKFLRALIYFNLANVFDSLSICTNVFNWNWNTAANDYANSNILPKPLYSIYDVYKQIKSDLVSAIIDLPTRNTLDYDNRFRATKGAARALLSKVYLFESSYAKNYTVDSRFTGMEQNWDSALYQAEAVINSGEYNLIGSSGETFDTWWDSTYLYPESTPAFRYIFTVKGNDSKEIVFPAINLTMDEAWTSYGDNQITIYNTVRYCNINGLRTSGPGWGLNAPTQALVDSFKSETGDPTDDPRFQVTIGGKEDSVLYEYQDSIAWYAMDFDLVNYACRKYECAPEDYLHNFSFYESPIDIPIIRYSDVILIAAEASLELGKEPEALSYINLVRTRARLSGNTGYPADLTSISLKDIMKERQLELAMEGHRFYDLVRWGIADDVLNNRFITSHNINATFEKDIDEFLPIPVGAIGEISSVVSTKNAVLNIYPNPTYDFLTIENIINSAQIVIYDLQGRIMLEKKADGQNIKLDIRDLPVGIYSIQVTDQENTSLMKFIKQ